MTDAEFAYEAEQRIKELRMRKRTMVALFHRFLGQAKMARGLGFQHLAITTLNNTSVTRREAVRLSKAINFFEKQVSDLLTPPQAKP